MEPKFIITDEGILRLGYVHMHKDLLQPGDRCIGGGFWSVDYVSNRLVLSGKSYDYGKPKWHYLDKLSVPEEYKGLTIVYEGDSLADSCNVSEMLPTEWRKAEH
jgi:hypothetical protein